jgi:hypothetical protein
MLEYWGGGGTTDGANYLQLHQDLTLGRNSAWQQGAAIGPACTWSRVVAFISGSVTICENSKIVRQYTKFIRPGSQRIGASSTNGVFEPAAFVRPDGGYVVVVKAEGGFGSFSVSGLPAGSYGLSYATQSTWNIQLPNITITAGQLLSTSIPGEGVLTISARAGGAPPPSPPSDADGDGVPDSTDACPNTPEREPVNASGCAASQRDADGDGVTDDQDQCPSTPPGSQVDPNTGCEIPVPPPPPTPPPPPPPMPSPPTESCVTDPLTVSVSRWPDGQTGSSQLRYSTNRTIVRLVLEVNPQRLTVTDARGCTATSTR